MSIVRLAKDLGLSVSTVSRALNGYDDVSAETRERVFQRAQKIGYRPNPGARRLKTGKTMAIGVVLPAANSGGQFIDVMYSNLLGGVAAEVEKANYYLLATKLTTQDLRQEVSFYENFINGSWVDALVIVRTRLRDPRVELAQRAGLPFVTYGRTNSKKPYAWVDADNESAFYLATSRQLSFGHRRIALLNGPIEFSFARLRQAGYEKALADAGTALDPALVLHGDLTEKSGYDMCRSLLALANAPTSFVCATDTMAIGAMAACREKNLEVGKDVSVTGYSNSPASAFCSPPLTTVEHQVFENGRHVGQSLIQLLAGAAPETVHHLEPAVVVPRQSDGPLPGTRA
jgi:LacI family transcriptional regulator